MTTSCAKRSLGVAAWLILVVSSSRSAAQTTASESQLASADPSVDAEPDPYMARKLFLEGRSLLDQGRAQEACERLERSQQLSPAIGTLLNLGLCYHYTDRLATAHEYYRRAEVMATLAGDEQRRELAHDEAAAIGAERATLTLRWMGAQPDPSLEIELDGAAQVAEVWQRPQYVDAGEHRVAVHQPGREPWHGSVQVKNGGKYVLVIPELRPEAAVAPQPSAASSAALSPVRAARTLTNEVDRSTGKTARVVAATVGVAGVVALGVSAIFGAQAISSAHESNPYCIHTTCVAKGIELRSDAHTSASRATVIGLAGAVAIVSAGAVWLLTPHDIADIPPTKSLASSWPDGYRAHF